MENDIDSADKSVDSLSLDDLPEVSVLLIMSELNVHIDITVLIVSFGQTGLGKQCRPRSDCSDQGLQCLPSFRVHLLDALLYCKTTLFEI